jgi:hypothetical protein
MDVLRIEEKDYVKSSVLARELGYTSDYIGQLCRGGKVDAKLFGRTWYVERSSVEGHKTTRYRSSKKVTHKNLKAHLSGPSQEKVEIHTHPFRSEESLNQKRYRQNNQVNKPFYLKNAGIGYSNDSADLIPTPSKKIPISLADASTVSITSAKETLVFETPSLPEVRFRGRLAVSTYEDTDAVTTEAVSAVDALSKPQSADQGMTPQANNVLRNKVISPKMHKKNKGTHLLVHETQSGTYPILITHQNGEMHVSWLWSFVRYSLATCVLIALFLLPLLLGHAVTFSEAKNSHRIFLDSRAIEKFYDFVR